MLPKEAVCNGFLLVIFLMLYSATESANSPGVCTMRVPANSLVGNANGNTYTTVEICCNGWKRKPNRYRFECEPICHGGCENGNCTAPNVCLCKHNHIKDNFQKCVPTCPIGCSNGFCFQGRCQCHDGYTPDSVNQKYCVPACIGDCGVGGECVAPGTCRCRQGYMLDGKTNKCVHHCPADCGPGGSCVGPNQCQCRPGYKLIQNKCQPSCPKGCSYGVCTAPNRCTCSTGWRLSADGTRCEYRCSQQCLNGDCTGPEICTCKKGYVLDPRNRYRCIPHCPQGCPNGVCTYPNFCVCNQGYVKDPYNKERCVLNRRGPVLY